MMFDGKMSHVESERSKRGCLLVPFKPVDIQAGLLVVSATVVQQPDRSLETVLVET